MSISAYPQFKGLEDLPRQDTDADRMRRLLGPSPLSVDLVSAFAGDRPQSNAEIQYLGEMRSERTEQFFSDLLYAISHHYFPPEIAEQLWGEVLRHKYELSEKLGRNVRITVATLDYLSNIKNELVASTLIGETHVADMANLSMRDGLTGLFNHTSCLELINLEFGLFNRYGTIFSLLILDIDDFKKINDNFGHPIGDRVLAELSKMLIEETRESDICCRYGGEEFVVLMPLTDLLEASRIAERVREKVSRYDFGGQKVTASLGVVSCHAGVASPLLLIKAADDALYRAKRDGKNRVAYASGHSDQLLTNAQLSERSGSG